MKTGDKITKAAANGDLNRQATMSSQHSRFASTYPVYWSLDTAPYHFLFLDAVIATDGLSLISAFYLDLEIDFREVEVSLNGVELKHFDEIGKAVYESPRIIFYPWSADPRPTSVELKVRYRGTEKHWTLPTAQPAAATCAIATLFKDDFAAVESFVAYHRTQGFDRFILYYNGDVKQIAANLPQAEDIVYGSWPFQYWLPRPPERFWAMCMRKLLRRHLAIHLAQTAFLAMVRQRWLPRCGFLALTDLDEFLWVEGETVKEHLLRENPSTLAARCYWARRETQEAGNEQGLRLSANCHPAVDYWGLRPARPKSIYRRDYANLFGIHYPRPPALPFISSSLGFYHIINGRTERESFLEAEHKCRTIFLPLR